MEQILIYHPDGTNEAINSHSRISVITQAEHHKVLLGEDVINLTVESATARNFGIGDYIRVLDLPDYRINQLPNVSRTAQRRFRYELVFEGMQYDLLRVAYRNTDIGSFNNATDFSLIGNLQMFLEVLVNNLNRIFGAGVWALGEYPAATETKNLLFNNENCLSVLQRLCDEYKYQFSFQQTISQKVLHVKNAGTALDFSFRYGHGKGLYQLSRENVDSKNIINTLWAYGSDKNLPANYKNYSPRLRIGSGDDAPVLEATSRAMHGIFEGSVVFEEVFPHRTGTVSAIDSAKRFDFVDTGMFDLNAKSGDNTLYLIPGNAAKVRFQTGNLAGYEFEVEKYVHASHTFTIKQNKDAKGLEMPSLTEAAFQIQPGDTYVLVDIVMPQAYITAAEEELEARAIEYLENNANPTVKYGLELDEFYVRQAAESLNVFEVGDTVAIQDAELGIDMRIRIAEFTRDILRPYKYTLTIQDAPQVNAMRSFVVQNKYIRDFMKLNGLDDPVRGNTDWRSDTQLLSEIPGYINNTKNLPVGKGAENIEIGNNSSLTKIFGALGIVNPFGAVAEISTDLLQANARYTFKFPDANPEGVTVLNDWNYIVAKPTFFFQQDTAASTWVVVHQLGKKCLCQAFDSGGNQIFGNIRHITTTNYK